MKLHSSLLLHFQAGVIQSNSPGRKTQFCTTSEKSVLSLLFHSLWEGKNNSYLSLLFCYMVRLWMDVSFYSLHTGKVSQNQPKKSHWTKILPKQNEKEIGYRRCTKYMQLIYWAKLWRTLTFLTIVFFVHRKSFEVGLSYLIPSNRFLCSPTYKTFSFATLKSGEMLRQQTRS